jgi:type IV secretion system protein VirB10
MSAAKLPPDEVRGERSETLVSRAGSLQSRLSGALALALMSVLGISSLTWYYAHNLSRQDRARQSAQRASAIPAQGDTALPSIGRIDPPRPEVPEEQSSPVATENLTEIPLGPAPASVSGVNAMPPPPSPLQVAEARQLSGAVFSDGVPSSARGRPVASDQQPAPPEQIGAADPSAKSSQGDLAPLLKASLAESVRAKVLPAQRLLLPKGAFIDCTLETAIDSSLPGMTTCILAADTFGVDGNVVLLERGTKLVGETRGQVQQGSARVFVLWTEARTPAGVVVPFDSPGADELGRSGLPGEVHRHFWERFGAAMLISVVDGAVQTAATRNGGGTVILDPSASQGVMTEALKGTVNIAPTVTKKNGDRIQVLVARDVDFRSVYELRSVIGQ